MRQADRASLTLEQPVEFFTPMQGELGASTSGATMLAVDPLRENGTAL
jgi:hypothetical protein